MTMHVHVHVYNISGINLFDFHHQLSTNPVRHIYDSLYYVYQIIPPPPQVIYSGLPISDLILFGVSNIPWC